MKETSQARFSGLSRLCRLAPASLAVLALVLGCASSGIGRARSLVKDNGLIEATPMLEELALAEPTNGEVLDLLGQAYYRAGRFEDAEVRLNKAQSLGFWSAEGVLYRGLMRERKGDLDGAVRVYRSYAAIPSRQAQRRIRGRIQLLLRQRLKDEMAQLVREESSRGAAGDRLTIGVFPFQYVGASSDLQVLGRGLAEFMITDLSMVRKLRVLERPRIAALMEEIGLGASGLVDETTALRMGRIAGAGTVLNGVYRDHATGLSIETALAEVAQGRLDNLTPVGGALEQVFDLEKTVVFDAISHLGVELTEIEREDIARVPTRSLLAFLSFSRGLEAEDKGQWQAARAHYEAAVKEDPKFEKAVVKAAELAEVNDVAEDIDEFEREVVALPVDQMPPEDGLTAGAVSDALEDLAGSVTGGIEPGEDSREPSVTGEIGSPTMDIEIFFP